DREQAGADPGGVPLLIVSVALLMIHMIIAAPRLKNAGYSPWLTVLLIVPVANLWAHFVTLLAPENYASTRKLDRVGTGCAVAILLIAVAVVVLAVVSMLNAP
ncbi:MAG: hypothetical protein AB1725_10260, partial [Armatimonadota bacterium]